MGQEWGWGDYTISTSRDRLDLKVIHGFLTESYWAKGRSLETVEKSIEHSQPFGLYSNQTGEQIGFARAITDYTTFAYLADVFVLQPFRGQGLGRWLVQTVLESPELRSIPRWRLVTQDAQALYQQIGFTSLRSPDQHMEKLIGEANQDSLET
ncbi:GNAT family N-acetyltransferase [Leptolyngbya ohadii]|uniref:GNAT family N-acetyltransferase n=1 Tax=Leptolyngbya ohadii TaxID=1962290 RepID=UPI0019D44C38|nr:GNAT family N-acetyltransferase [Leptolyngbya ohadii]